MFIISYMPCLWSCDQGSVIHTGLTGPGVFAMARTWPGPEISPFLSLFGPFSHNCLGQNPVPDPARIRNKPVDPARTRPGPDQKTILVDHRPLPVIYELPNHDVTWI